jgi:uncharacterized protein YidB (DUF937 family)
LLLWCALRGLLNRTPEWQAWVYDNSFAGGVFRRRGQFRGHLEDKMGLLDILNTLGGTSGDPRARPAPNQGTGQATSQGMSPMAKALLALLAIYAMKNMRRADSAPSQPARRPGDVNAGLPGGGSSGGGLGDLLRGTLGGVLGGAAAGTVLNGGLGGLLKQFQQSGQGDVAHSWIGTGPNKQISEGELASALGTDTLDTLSKQTGMGREDLLSGLSQHLPRFVDQLTPDGRLPNDDEAQRMV